MNIENQNKDYKYYYPVLCSIYLHVFNPLSYGRFSSIHRIIHHGR